MKLAIMQPYFFPYIGYFQLINAVDKFVVYDNIEYTKKSWINRNRILLNGTDSLFTLPLRKDSDFLNINQRFLAENFHEYKNKLLRQISAAYAKAPQFKSAYSIIEECFSFNNNNLFAFIIHSLNKTCGYLNLTTEFVVSSTIENGTELKGEHKVIKINKKLGSSIYINAIGGQELYSRETFTKNNVELKFIKSYPVVYSQFKNDFVPNLSIIDVLMFNSKTQIADYLSAYSLI